MVEKNELMTMEESTFRYDFKPAVIEIKNYENLIETAEMVAKHYDSLVLTDSTLSEINETHRELNSFVKGLDESRLNVKREYNKPLEEFEDDIKSVINILNAPLQKIKDARDEILTKEEEARREALMDYIERQLKGRKVRIEDIEMPSSWTNKGNWTDKLNPRKKLTDEIKREIKLIEEENKKKLAEREILETFLDEKGMEHDGWLAQLEYKEALDIIQDIQRAEERKKQEEKQKENYEKELERIKEVTEQELDRDFEEIEDTVEEQLITERIEVTGTVEQLNQLNQYMIENGIKVAPILDELSIAIDDLPFGEGEWE